MSISNYLAQLLLLLATTAIVFLDARVLTENKLNPRIVNGVEITIKDAPWQVAILRNDTHSCGGAIYSENIIVTAAHCLYGTPPQSLTVRAGSTYRNFGGQVRQVVEFKVHEYYVHHDKHMINGSDIAVMRLDRPLTLSDVVKSIALATEEPAVGVNVFVSGWGKSKINTELYPTHLNGVTLKVISMNQCASIYYAFPPTGSVITGDMICAAEKDKDVCSGDSGGPLVLNNNQLVGIVSFGSCREYPSFYASVAYFHSWLLDAIKYLNQK